MLSHMCMEQEQLNLAMPKLNGIHCVHLGGKYTMPEHRSFPSFLMLYHKLQYLYFLFPPIRLLLLPLKKTHVLKCQTGAWFGIRDFFNTVQWISLLQKIVTSLDQCCFILVKTRFILYSYKNKKKKQLFCVIPLRNSSQDWVVWMKTTNSHAALEIFTYHLLVTNN